MTDGFFLSSLFFSSYSYTLYSSFNGQLIIVSELFLGIIIVPLVTVVKQENSH